MQNDRHFACENITLPQTSFAGGNERNRIDRGRPYPTVVNPVEENVPITTKILISVISFLVEEVKMLCND